MSGTGTGRGAGGARRPGTAGRAGFGLVEVLVGLVVLEVGLLGVAGIVALAAGLLADSARTERALYAAEELADSLAEDAAPSEGEREVAGGVLRWRVAAEPGEPLARIRIVAAARDGRLLFDLRGLARAAHAESGGTGETGS